MLTGVTCASDSSGFAGVGCLMAGGVVEPSVSRLERGLLIVAAALAAGFFAVALWVPSPWRDLFVGMATSFVFFVVFDLIVSIRRSLRQRQRRAFFGSDMFDTESCLVLADFVLRDDISSRLTEDERQAPYQRPKVRGMPDHEHPITQTTMMCLLDFQAVVGIAEEIAPWCARPPRITVDSRVLEEGATTFVASGLTDNHLTELYLQTDPHPLFTISSRDMVTTVTIADGHVISNTSAQEFGIIVRFHPQRSRHPDRRWFFVAGLDEAGSAAAGQFLAREWRRLAKLAKPDDDFLAVVSLPRRVWQEPTLDRLLTRSPSGAVAVKDRAQMSS